MQCVCEPYQKMINFANALQGAAGLRALYLLGWGMAIKTKTGLGKPFLKWAGGKSQLLPAIDMFLPHNINLQREITYIEPFVGGGAVLFYMLQKYPNIKKAVINDINLRLVKTYVTIKDQPLQLIERLSSLQEAYKRLPNEDNRKDFYLEIRDKFNGANLSDTEQSAYMIFLNRTCFNGLYRENSKGGFNVPFGKYANPTICDSDLIMADSKLLQKVIITNGDFSGTERFREGYTLFYFDPPYRPLNTTSSFNSYVKELFNDDEQIRLKNFFTSLSNDGCYALLSNSDCKACDPEDDFFDMLYQDFIIERVYAKRAINANPSKRGKLTELLIRNYEKIKGADWGLFNEN